MGSSLLVCAGVIGICSVWLHVRRPPLAARGATAAVSHKPSRSCASHAAAIGCSLGVVLVPRSLPGATRQFIIYLVASHTCSVQCTHTWVLPRLHSIIWVVTAGLAQKATVKCVELFAGVASIKGSFNGHGLPAAALDISRRPRKGGSMQWPQSYGWNLGGSSGAARPAPPGRPA